MPTDGRTLFSGGTIERGNAVKGGCPQKSLRRHCPSPSTVPPRMGKMEMQVSGANSRSLIFRFPVCGRHFVGHGSQARGDARKPGINGGCPPILPSRPGIFSHGYFAGVKYAVKGAAKAVVTQFEI